MDRIGAGLLLTFYPEGGQTRAAQFRAEVDTTGGAASVAIPVRDFCGLARGGRMAVSLIERPDSAQDVPVDEEAKSLLDEACAPVASAAGGRDDEASRVSMPPSD